MALPVNDIAATLASVAVLLVLCRTYSGDIGRNVAARTIWPAQLVRAVTAVSTWEVSDEAFRAAVIVKDLVFLGVVIMIRFGPDDSPIGKSEWFPWQRHGQQGVAKKE